MGWSNKNTVNLSAKGLWNQDIFDVKIADALRDKNSATVHLNVEKIKALSKDVSFGMPVEEGWSNIPFTVDTRNKNTITASVMSEVMLTPSAMVIAGLTKKDVHAHFYGADSVHGTYDVFAKDYSVDNCFEYVREADGLDYETATSLDDDRYHRSTISLSAPTSVLRPRVVSESGQERMSVQIPVPESLSPSGVAKLELPSERVVMDGAGKAHVQLGDQLNMYVLSYENADGVSVDKRMLAADVAHNVKRVAASRGVDMSVGMHTTVSKMRVPDILSEMSAENEMDYEA